MAPHWLIFTALWSHLLVCSLTDDAASSPLPVLDIAKLPDTVGSSEKTIVLFTRDGACSACESAARVAQSVATDTNLAAFQVKQKQATSTADDTSAIYVDRVPTIVLFLASTPIIYEGAVDVDSLSEFVSSTRQPGVLTLNDLNFEHLTQASTGATTGDWLIVFRSSQCDRCVALQSRLEAVAAKLRARLSVAWMDSQGEGRLTAARLHVQHSPQLLLLRQGVMYEYTSSQYDVASISSFVVGLYRHAPNSPVPSLPESPVVFWSQIALAAVVILFVIFKVLTSQKKSPVKKSH